MKTGSSEDAEVLTLIYGKGKSNQYTNEDDENRGLNLVSNRVEYSGKESQPIAPIAEAVPLIASYDSNPFQNRIATLTKGPYSASSNYDDVVGMLGATPITGKLGSVKSSDMWTHGSAVTR